ncbi:hypothetical protein C8R47DRAFT_1082694 [Mycena vitilis]|nr:hypothetical protein C8R47DRAFT_1082694 [Mycena vitilis]
MGCAAVYWLLFLDLAQTASPPTLHSESFVTGWGDPNLVSVDGETLQVASIGDIYYGILQVSFSVQLFFAWRISVLAGDKNRYVLEICVLIVVVELKQSLSAIVNGIRYAFSSQLSDILQPIVGVENFGSAVCDIVIALTMITIGPASYGVFAQLTRYRRMTPWKKSDNVITKLIYNTVETGAITAITAIVEVILFLLYPQYLFHETPYSNVVLVTLNSRSTAPWGGIINTGVLSTRSTSTRQSHQLQLRTPITMSDKNTGELHASGTAIGADSDIDGKAADM